MGGVSQLRSYTESNVITYNTAYSAGTFDVPGMTVEVETSGARLFVGLVGQLNALAYSQTSTIRGKNPVLSHISEGAVAGAGSWTIVSTGGTTPIIQPTITGNKYLNMNGDGDIRLEYFAYGGSGIGLDSTWSWQYLNGYRAYFGVRTLEPEPALNGTWNLSILRTTGVTTTTPFNFGSPYRKLGIENFQMNGLYCIDQPARGVHTYKVQLYSSATNGRFGLTNVKLVAYEI